MTLETTVVSHMRHAPNWKLLSAIRPLRLLAYLSLFSSAYQFLRVLHARSIIPDLTHPVQGESPHDREPLPPVSVVVAARNEAPALRRALPTLLSQDYPRLQVIVVNDRSTDDTQRVIEDLASKPWPADGSASDREISAISLQVRSLPEGWLGKSHALYRGARRATGEWLLFTDADVCFAPSTLRRAVEYAERESLDHLTLVPKMDIDGYWLRAVVAYFYLGYMINLGMYRTNVPGSRVGLGIGAFNLLNRDAYRRVGTYEALRLSAADDYSLGHAVKRAGLKQRLLTGVGDEIEPPAIRLRWYDSLTEFLRGVEKNVLPVCAYNPLKVLSVVLTVQLTCVVPFVAPLFASVRAERWILAMYASAVTLNFASSAQFNHHQRHPRPFLLALGYPISTLISSYALLRAVIVVLRDGGIEWRDTFYSLETLRAAEVNEREELPIARH